MFDRHRLAMESRTGVVALLSGIWLVMAPVVLHFDAAGKGFRPYWTAMVVASVLMVVGLFRAMAPLDVPFAGLATALLAGWLVLAAWLFSAPDASAAVRLNQVLFAGGVLVACAVNMILTRRR